MSLLTLSSLAFGASVVLLAAASAVAILFRAHPWLETRDAAFLLSIACLFGGPLIASIATPDWSPFTMAWLYVPFLLIGVWMGAVSSSRSRRDTALTATASITADGRERAYHAHRLAAESQADAEFAALLEDSHGLQKIAVLYRRWRRARSLAANYVPADRTVMF